MLCSFESSVFKIFLFQLETPSDLLIVEFPSSSAGQRRRKREWVIPFYNMVENESGDFPKKMFQVCKNNEMTVVNYINMRRFI